MIERSREAEEFIASVNTVDPRAVSACEGWTTHEIAAHVTGIAVEVTRHLEPYLQGEPVPETRSFEVREAPLREMGHEALLRRLDVEEERMRHLVDDVLAREPDAVIPWTGREMAVEKFIPHLRNEHALHRWDIVGDDAVSAALLGQFDLVDHSVGELGHVLLAAGREHDPDPDNDFSVRLRSDGQRDLRVLVLDGDAHLAWSDDDEVGDADEPMLHIEPGARHVFIWGRRPDFRGGMHSQLAQPDLARLQSLLSGY